MNLSFWKFIEVGGVALWVIIGLSVLAVAEGRAACERSKSPLADVFLIGFERFGRSSRDALEAAVDRERQRINLDMKVRLWILGTIGATAPFIGLYGTV